MTHKPMATPNKSVSKSCVPITSAAVCAAYLAPSASRVTPSPVGSKKEAALPELSETLADPDPEVVALELDELWSFVLKRANKRWVWIALCRATRQVVAYAVGDRSRVTCQKLWAAVPVAYRRGHCFSDFWEAYQLVTLGAAHGRGQGVGPDGARRKMEQHATPKARALRQEELVILEV